ncbi:uncharacterized protein c16h19orf85 [Denticeps clupeoides]|uniref:uncharacterized protein c16h19orf85 n=1 Tax=Denticeps clupeoides TaxID=299321 RepID=UPI0010A2B686|nr:uncharacterized protein LOC114790714 [Denticeps clupeoides]
MRPSSTMAFETGVEHGAPWGRDLFTFVTSAAGHMMRTLQKPRKNRPSKRQVNHRRFLHNMIQRKFAEIEAANHQLASSLFSSAAPPDQLGSKSPQRVNNDPDILKEGMSVCSHETKTYESQEKEDGSCFHNRLVERKIHQTSLRNGPNLKTICSPKWKPTNGGPTGGGNKKTDKGRLCNTEEVEHPPVPGCEGGLQEASCLDYDSWVSEDKICTWLDSIDRIRHSPELFTPHSSKSRDLSPHFNVPSSPEISPLSFDSCDFGVQMKTVSPHHYQVQGKGTAERQQLYMADGLNDVLGQQNPQVTMATSWNSHCTAQGDSAFLNSMDSQRSHVSESDVSSQDAETPSCQLKNAEDSVVHGSRGITTRCHDTFRESGSFFNQAHHASVADDSFGLLQNPSLDLTRGQLSTCVNAHAGYWGRETPDITGLNVDGVDCIGSECRYSGSAAPCAQHPLVTSDVMFTPLSEAMEGHVTGTSSNQYNCLRSSCVHRENTGLYSYSAASQGQTPFMGVALSFPAPVQKPQSNHAP